MRQQICRRGLPEAPAARPPSAPGWLRGGPGLPLGPSGSPTLALTRGPGKAGVSPRRGCRAGQAGRCPSLTSRLPVPPRTRPAGAVSRLTEAGAASPRGLADPSREPVGAGPCGSRFPEVGAPHPLVLPLKGPRKPLTIRNRPAFTRGKFPPKVNMAGGQRDPGLQGRGGPRGRAARGGGGGLVCGPRAPAPPPSLPGPSGAQPGGPRTRLLGSRLPGAPDLPAPRGLPQLCPSPQGRPVLQPACGPSSPGCGGRQGSSSFF